MSRSRNPWLITLVLALSGLLASLQQTLVVPLLPDFPELLDITPDDSSWLVTITLLSGAVATPVISRAADMFGKRRMVLLTLTIMSLGSLLAAVGGDSFVMLLIGRGMQGFATALIPVGISIMRDELPKEKVGSATALMSATLGIGAALGLPLSGLISDQFGWHALFWLSGSLSVLAVIGVFVVVPESTVLTPGRFDVVGAVLLSGALTTLLLVISKGSTWGWTSPPLLGCAALTVILFAVWIPYQLRSNEPLTDLRTTTSRPVLLTNLASLLVASAMFVNLLVTTQQLQLPTGLGYGFGLSVLGAGLAMMPAGLVQVVIAPIGGQMLNRLGGRTTLMIGAGVMAVSYLGRVFLDDTLAQVIVGSALVNVGLAIAFASMPALIMNAVPITETASANGINSLVRSIGTSSSSAMVGALLAALTIDHQGLPVPSLGGIHLAYWIAGLCAALAVGITVLIPADHKVAAGLAARTRIGAGAVEEPAGEEAEETVVRGRVLLGRGPELTRPTVVTVLDLDGRQVDWTRADHDGNYAVAVPGKGDYLVIANAQGFAPHAQVVTVDGDGSDAMVALEESLSLSGVVRVRGRAVEGAIVVLSEATGAAVARMRSGPDGEYRFGLPPAGNYVIAGFDSDSGLAGAGKITAGVQSTTYDLELVR
ncbi:MFS transporter [Microlunatus sp. Y2014]|uniref:MFS transporter n=1 Tax=Microlunatus sp. Y2014 TaxID=3418488 RepID=UPI003DA6EEDC